MLIRTHTQKEGLLIDAFSYSKDEFFALEKTLESAGVSTKYITIRAALR